MPDLRILIVGGLVVLWATLFMAALYLTGRIVGDHLRLVARSAVWAVFLSPGAVGGDGCAPVPTIIVVFVPGHLGIGLVEMAACFAAYVVIGKTILDFRRREDSR